MQMAQRRFAVARDFQQGGGDKRFIGCAQIAGDKQHVAIARLPHQSQQFVVIERRAERPRRAASGHSSKISKNRAQACVAFMKKTPFQTCTA